MNSSHLFSSSFSANNDATNHEQYGVIATLLCSATTSAISHSRARNILFNERLEETHAGDPPRSIHIYSPLSVLVYPH